MDEERRNACCVKVSRDMVQITYARSYQELLNAHASFAHRAALKLHAHPTKSNAYEYGRELYRLLFLADPKQNVSAVLKRCCDDPRCRVQVSIELVDETLAELLDLKWESLCDPDGCYLARDSRFRFARRLASLPLGKHAPLAGLPRVLVVISNPGNLESVTVKTVGPDGLQDHSFAPIEAPFSPQQTLGLADLFDGLKAKGQIAGYRILRGPLPSPHDGHPALLEGYPTLDRVHKVLRAAEEANQPYHIIHFLAHGYLDSNGDGCLLLTDEMGDAALVHQAAFQSLFPQEHHVRLIVLAACQSGSGDQKIGRSLAGLAPTFLRVGIPAVIAMQDKISVCGAAAFTETLYREMAEQGYIDTAVTEARRQVERRAPARDEWVIPVLYLQNEDPRLFKPAGTTHASYPAIANPFYTGGRINDPRLFFGRQRLIREICAELKKGCSISIVGESQMGKSSLLCYLYNTRGEWLPDRTVEFIDLQLVLDEADLCETLLSKLGESGDTLRALKRALTGRKLVLLLDEVERLAEADFNPRLHDLLRSLAQEPHFAMCLATQCSLTQVFPARTPGGVSPFHNIFTIKTLDPFTEAEARAFITTRLAGTDVIFTEHEIERLLAESRCHPAKLQAGAKLLFEEKIS